MFVELDIKGLRFSSCSRPFGRRITEWSQIMVVGASNGADITRALKNRTVVATVASNNNKEPLLQ